MSNYVQTLILKLIKHLLLADEDCSGCSGSIENKDTILTFDFNFDIKEK